MIERVQVESVPCPFCRGTRTHLIQVMAPVTHKMRRFWWCDDCSRSWDPEPELGIVELNENQD